MKLDCQPRPTRNTATQGMIDSSRKRTFLALIVYHRTLSCFVRVTQLVLYNKNGAYICDIKYYYDLMHIFYSKSLS